MHLTSNERKELLPHSPVDYCTCAPGWQLHLRWLDTYLLVDTNRHFFRTVKLLAGILSVSGYDRSVTDFIYFQISVYQFI